jgi:hypothetical protein
MSIVCAIVFVWIPLQFDSLLTHNISPPFGKVNYETLIPLFCLCLKLLFFKHLLLLRVYEQSQQLLYFLFISF